MKRTEAWKKGGIALLCGVVSGLLGWGLWAAGTLSVFEQPLWDVRVRLFARRSGASDRVRMILLDQDSLDWAAAAGIPWPWPREMYVPILGFLKRGGAKCVVFDVLYTEHSAYEVYDDLAFGEAIGEAGHFIGSVFLGGETGAFERWPEGVREPRWRVLGPRKWLSAESRKWLEKSRAVFPVMELARHCEQLGDVHDVADGDGVFRRAAPVNFFDGRAVPSLGMAAFLAGFEAPPAVRLEEGWMELDGQRVPLDEAGRVILRYRGGEDVYLPRKAAAVIQSEDNLQHGLEAAIDPGFFRDAYVFFGFSAPGLMDVRSTPVGRGVPGVLVHATLLDNLLAGDALRDVRTGVLAALLLAVSVLAGGGTVFARRAWHHALVFLAVLTGVTAAAFAAYPLGFWLPLAPLAVSAALAATAGLIVNFATEGRQKLFIKRAFQHYLSRDVIERILDNPDRLQLGGERKALSIFFSDVQGFSSFSEKMNPQELTALLNDYLSAMTEIIFAEGGTLDKYEGDAIIAFWNAPLDQEDHALRACRAALRCMRRIEEGRAAWRERFGVRIYARTGLHSGEVVVGNMGSRERFDYTVLGDAANLASRLEGANKAFGTFLMVSEETWKQTGGALTGRCLGRIRVVGRKTPVTVYEPLGENAAARPEWLSAYEEGLDAVSSRDWKTALEKFQGLEEDPVARKYAAQCAEVLASGGDWDGIWNLTEK